MAGVYAIRRKKERRNHANLQGRKDRYLAGGFVCRKIPVITGIFGAFDFPFGNGLATGKSFLTSLLHFLQNRSRIEGKGEMTI
ncbi:MAG: hypothetical protein IKU11_06005 [Clostridia bacterium]|nr:hypothetical protein [Clostridia bacterium]